MFMRAGVGLIVAGFFLAAGSVQGLAYEDEIGLHINEVWPSGVKALKAYGGRIDEKKKTIKTRWVEDQIVRRNKTLGKIPSRVYRRRYRFKIEFIENYYFTKVKITGTYQSKSVDATPGMPWHFLKSGTDEFILERSYFMRILNQIEKDRLARA